MCFKEISEIIIITNLKLHTFLKHAGRLRGGGHQIRKMTDKGRKGVKNKSNILPNVLCKWPFTKFCRCETVIPKPLLNFSQTYTF